jgi:hypothetical protein
MGEALRNMTNCVRSQDKSKAMQIFSMFELEMKHMPLLHLSTGAFIKPLIETRGRNKGKARTDVRPAAVLFTVFWVLRH